MRAIIKISDQITIEVEAEKQTELFRTVAQSLEAFLQTTCGLCQAAAIPGHRIVAGLEFCEMRCTNPDCGARLSFGQHKERHTLFRIRNLAANGKPDRKKGMPSPHAGWTKYRGGTSDADPEQQGAEPPAPAKLPTTGAELHAMLMQRDRELSGKSLCPSGALVDYVRAAGARAGHRGDMRQWPPTAVALGIAAAREFTGKLKVG
jgi:hypothetical protein